MTDGSDQPLNRAIEASAAYRVTQQARAGLLAERDGAIVEAIRLGARLEEVATASGISRAAVSKIGRRTLKSRTGRGGPYSRRRGTSAALHRVAGTAESLADARERVHRAKLQRDMAIASVVLRGGGVTETARAVGMTPAAVSVIARS